MSDVRGFAKNIFTHSFQDSTDKKETTPSAAAADGEQGGQLSAAADLERFDWLGSSVLESRVLAVAGRLY